MKPFRIRRTVIRSVHQCLPIWLAAAALLALPELALAHPGHDDGTGFSGLLTGLIHPFTGLDHLLGMIAIGLMLGRGPGGADRQYLPVVALALLAGALAGRSLGSPVVFEPLILMSIIVPAALAASALQAPRGAILWLLAPLLAAHSGTHGLEAAPGWSGAFALIGASVGSMALVVASQALAAGLERGRARTALRMFAAALAGAGLWLAAS